MPILLILPLALFAGILLLVAGTAVIVEIAERRRTRFRLRRKFRPIVIEGGKGRVVVAEQIHRAEDEALPEPGPVRLVRSAPQ